MLGELRTAYPDADVHILGLNEAGYEAGNSLLPGAGSLPALQDTQQANVKEAWSATYRDVVLVDEEGRFIEAYNLTQYSLGVAANYQTLKSKLEALLIP
jgi:hypothetical protein